MAATRLPDKVLIKILDKTILAYVVERVKKSDLIEDAVVATTTNPRDAKIVDAMNDSGIKTYRGSENDVLDRYYQAARHFNAEHVTRITADCPLIDPRVIDSVIGRYHETGADYCSNTIEETFPDGQDIEVFSFGTLHEAWKNASLSSEREHVTPYIRKHCEKFKLESVKNAIDLSCKRWTLDEERDLFLIKAVLENLYLKNSDFSMADVLEFLKANPEIEGVNKDITRNEGYLKSLKNDKIVKGS